MSGYNNNLRLSTSARVRFSRSKSSVLSLSPSSAFLRRLSRRSDLTTSNCRLSEISLLVSSLNYFVNKHKLIKLIMFKIICS